MATRTHRPPRTIALSPRSWLTRQPGECAFPIDGDGPSMTCCCNPSGRHAYCPDHESRARARNITSAKDYEREIIRFLEKRR